MPVPLKAAGNISPCRIVRVTSDGHGVTQAAASTAKPIGISGRSSRRAPGTAADDGYHAISGEACEVYQVGDRAMVETGGASGVTVGQELKSDANGRAITASSGDYVVGIALETATASSQFVRCAVLPGIM